MGQRDGEADQVSVKFAIFTYMANGQQYVEAYPTNNRPSDIFDGLDFDLVCAVSRNQARKLAYKKWVDPTGAGFNNFPRIHTWDLVT